MKDKNSGVEVLDINLVWISIRDLSGVYQSDPVLQLLQHDVSDVFHFRTWTFVIFSCLIFGDFCHIFDDVS